jgi:hypothetical protein
MTDTPDARLLDCGFCYEEQGEEVHPHPECPVGRPAVSSAGVVQLPPTNQATPSRRAGLREALRRATCEAEGFAWESDMLEPDEYGDHADAVLAVLYREWPWLRAEADEDEELTAQEARDLADELGTELYRAQDALAFVEECCVIADREGRQPTTADVREWLKGARCGRQLVADGRAPELPPLDQDPVARRLWLLPAPADRAAVLRDFLWRLEQSAGDAAAEKLLDDNPELRRMAAEAPATEEQPAQPRIDETQDADPIETSTEAALGQAEERLRQVLAVAEVIEANGIGWAADSVRRAAKGEPS